MRRGIGLLVLLDTYAWSQSVRCPRHLALRQRESVFTLNPSWHLGPWNVLVATEAVFRSQLSVPEVEAAIERLETTICEKYPIVG